MAAASCVCVMDVHPAQKLFLEEYRISSARVKEMNRRAAVQLDLDDELFDIKKGEEKGKNVGGLKNKETKQTYLPHTLNNTVVAPPRMLIAFLENNLNDDGSVRIPEALRMYMGGISVIEVR